jgi:hypothetical protein
LAPALLCPHSRGSSQGNATATKITASAELAVGERRKLVRDALRLSLWRAIGCSGLWKDLECCSIPVVDGAAGRSG